MSTRQDYLSLVKQRQAQDRTVSLSLLKSAAVQAEKLTSSPEWDRFLSQVMARRNEFQAEYESWRNILEDAIEPDKVKQAQIAVAVNKMCARLLDEIMDLPQAILKEHADVKPRSGDDGPAT